MLHNIQQCNAQQPIMNSRTTNKFPPCSKKMSCVQHNCEFIVPPLQEESERIYSSVSLFDFFIKYTIKPVISHMTIFATIHEIHGVHAR